MSTKHEISERKADHIDICLKEPVESSSAGFDQIRFPHSALPEIDFSEIKLEKIFLGYPIRLPFFISCMTGGSEEGRKANQILAKTAAKFQIPIGLGSMRVLLEDEGRFEDFAIRKWADNVPILANFGAVQLRDLGPEPLLEWTKRVEADALVIHLNAGQELFQPEGDRDFRALFEAIQKLTEASPFPIIVKETGFGIFPNQVRKLLSMGVSMVDLAGSGGTNWVLVERARGEFYGASAAEFAEWGLPTAPLLAACRKFHGKILASGGVRSGLDVAKALALGASAVGMALPLIQTALNGGEEATMKYLEQIEYSVKSAHLLTGSKTVQELQKVPLFFSQSFREKEEWMSQ